MYALVYYAPLMNACSPYQADKLLLSHWLDFVQHNQNVSYTCTGKILAYFFYKYINKNGCDTLFHFKIESVSYDNILKYFIFHCFDILKNQYHCISFISRLCTAEML